MYRSVFLAGLSATAVLASMLPGPVSAAETPVFGFDRDAMTVAATKDVPSFGGAYVDEKTGAVHVWLTRPAAAGAARARAAMASGLGVAAGGTDTVIHQADYSFAQLKSWHDRVTDLLSTPGVTMTDVDERTNRVTVGVDDPARAAELVTSRLAGLGIPRAAVTVVSATAATPTLRDQTRPLTSGTQIQSEATLPICTLGFIAVRNVGEVGFVTNSHCSLTRGAVDSGRYWQASRPGNDSGVIGIETVDPRLTGGFGCTRGRICRRSDSNFVSSDSGVRLGQIARPPASSTNWNGTDLYRITAVGRTANGRTVTKVGRTTGNTSGTVVRSCVARNVADSLITMLCQDMAAMTTAPGDSGSPVFEVTNSPSTNDVRLVGIHWGSGTLDGVQTATFSPFEQVNAEVGPLRVCATGGC